MITLQRNEAGVANALLIPMIVVSLLLVACLGFAGWAFSGMQSYKNDSDSKSADAVSAALKQEDAKKAAEFAEESKNPLKTYVGPAAYGSLQLQYPRTWSAYIIDQSSSGSNIDAYFNPNFVPSVSSQSSSFALRARIVNQSYATVLNSYQTSVKGQKLTASPYSFAKVPNVVGTRLNGEIRPDTQGSMILMPLRATTIEIWTEGTVASHDFETFILPNVSFSP